MLARLTGLMSGVCCWFLVLRLLLGVASEAQTNCAVQHAASGVFICYPNPSENRADTLVPGIFHLSAQGNPAGGQVIAGYKVLIDNRLVYENRFFAPLQNLSIETNLKSPFDSGMHTLRLVVQGAGSAEVKELQFYQPKNASFCDPFNRTDPRICSPSTIRGPRGPLQWSLPEVPPKPSSDAFDRYAAYVSLFGQNLKSIEADVSDAMTVDAQGNLYVASHAFADVDLRKYAPDGSLIHASLIRSCGDGFLSVAGLAIDNAGRAWIAGNTTACLPASPNAVPVHLSEGSRTRGFVLLVDTTKPSSAEPLFVTYLSDAENRIAAIRVDSEGNAYVTGMTASREFPHESLLSAGSVPFRGAGIGFVSVLNPLGSGLLWSTLLENAQLTALALDGPGNVYVTGRVASDVLVAELSDRGRRLSYVARFGGSAEEEGQAISTTAQGAWILVAGATASPDFPTSLATKTPHRDLQTFAVGLQPCRTGVQHSRLFAEADSPIAPGIALGPALDAFATGFLGEVGTTGSIKAGQKPIASVAIAPTCSSSKP
jgi:hypothetical protein